MYKSFTSKLIVVLVFTLINCAQKATANEIEAFHMSDRIKQIKKSTVRILVNGKPSGSGFVISKNGLIATCFHIVQNAQEVDTGIIINYAKSIEVELCNGKKLSAVVHESCLKEGFFEAIAKDYCILKVKSNDLTPLSIGSFVDAHEGNNIYICGFPFGINQPVVSVGILSTKWETQAYLVQGNKREVAWLDITMNNGNSGGPIVLMTKDPKGDRVIGIAEFNLNPFAKPSYELVQYVQGFPGTMVIMGVDFKEFSTFIAKALISNSLGVGGCISIDYLKKNLK